MSGPHALRLITSEDLERLPVPVARALTFAGVVGKPIPTAVRLTQTGQIRAAEDQPWRKFTAVETYDVNQPAFVWSAKLKAGGVPLVSAVDTLSHGRGRMHVRLGGFINLVDATGPEMDQGTLMRWLNETMWFPQAWATDLISWKAIDDTSAIGSLTDHETTVEAEFRFDADGRLIDFRADRYREVDGEFVMTPWSTPLTHHARFDGLTLPSAGSGLWHLPDHDLEYIRITIQGITHATHAQ